MRKCVSLFLLFVVISGLIFQPASAQESGPIYIVQAGDTLSFIASRFNLAVNDLIAANPAIDPNFLSQGQQIVIPGLEGVTGILETEIISFGDTLRSLSRRTQVSDTQLKKLNLRVPSTSQKMNCLQYCRSIRVPVAQKARTGPRCLHVCTECMVKSRAGKLQNWTGNPGMVPVSKPALYNLMVPLLMDFLKQKVVCIAW